MLLSFNLYTERILILARYINGADPIQFRNFYGKYNSNVKKNSPETPKPNTKWTQPGEKDGQVDWSKTVTNVQN